MPLADRFVAELRNEAATTRRVLERVPEDRLSWKPHAKSMSLGQLAMHIASLPGGLAEFLSEPIREAPTVPLLEGASLYQILSKLDESVASAAARVSDWSDEWLDARWTMTREGRTLIEVPRIDMMRNVMLNHWYHHRGQLTVYLRLLDVPVPSVYGPSADENPFA